MKQQIEKRHNRWIAFFLCLCMVISSVTTTVFAVSNANQADENTDETVYIDAKYFKFICKTAEESTDPDVDWDVNITDAGQAAIRENGLPSGHLAANAPEEINDNGQWHSFVNAEVNGVEIHSIGRLNIGGEEKVYYTTNSTTPTCAVYNVLRENEQITLNYEHMQGHLIDYSVKMENDGSLPAGINNDSVFGSHPTLTTNADTTAAFSVTIPRGYKATVQAWHVEKDGDEWPDTPDESNSHLVQLTSDKTETPGDNSILLGAMRKYEGTGSSQTLNMAENATDSLTDTIHVLKHGGNHNPGTTRLYVVVTLKKNEGPFTFDATGWLNTNNIAAREESKDPAIVWDFGKTKDNLNDGVNSLTNLSGLNQSKINSSGKSAITNGTTEWEFRTLTTFLSGNGGNADGALQDGYAAWALNLLEINGEQVNVPVLPEFSNLDYPLSAQSFKQRPNTGGSTTTINLFDNYFPKGADGKPDTNRVVATEETTLSTGTKVTITVEGVLLPSYPHVVGKGNAQQGDYAYFRTYTITVENCQEDLTVTAMNFSKDSLKALILSTKGVTDTQVWNHPLWQGEGASGKSGWLAAEGVEGRLIDRSNSRQNANWYTDPIRFKRQLGYMPPKITLTDSLGNTLWTQDGTSPYWRNLEAPWELKGISSNERVQLSSFYYMANPAGELLVPTSGAITSADKFAHIRMITTANSNPPYTTDYDTLGFTWRRSAAKDPAHFYDVVTDSNWAKQTAPGDGSNSISWDYKAWTNLDDIDRGADGYYYFRTTEGLDRYMYTETGTKNTNIAYNNNWGKVYVNISAEPIKVNVKYENGLDIEDYTEKPQADTISNMPGADNSGYNVENNRTVLISSQIPQTTEEYAFDHWELWVGENRIEIEGKPVTYTSSQSVTINEALEAALHGNFNLNSDTVTVTLKAVWKPQTEQLPVNYDVNFWIPANIAKLVLGDAYDGSLENTKIVDGETWYSIRYDQHQIADDGQVVAALYQDADNNVLSDHVTNTLNGSWREGKTDFTKDGIIKYTVKTGGSYTHENLAWTIDSQKGENEVDIFLSADEDMDITVKKAWDGNAPENATVSVQLYKKAGDDTDYTKVEGQSLSLTKDSWSGKFENLPMFENGEMVRYYAFEMNSDSRVEDGGTIEIEGTPYLVAYTNNGVTGQSASKEITIANTENTGTLTVTKEVKGAGCNPNQEFQFTVTLSSGTNDDSALNRTYGDVNFSGGVGTFSLKGGETKILAGIPAGTGYQVEETPVTGYKTEYSDNQSGTIQQDVTEQVTVTNTRGAGTLIVQKVTTAGGNENKEFHFTVTLSEKIPAGKYGEMDFNAEGVAEFTLKPGAEMKAEKKAENLPEGVAFFVKETEENQDYYQTTYSGAEGSIKADETVTAVCTNTYVGNINIDAQKVWVDGSNQDGVRPESITLRLLADGLMIREQPLSGEGDTWDTAFTNLPEYSKGQKIVYTLEEVALPENSGYTSAIDGFTVTNTRTPATAPVTVTKQWNDSSDRYGLRPDEITLTLVGKVEGSDTPVYQNASVKLSKPAEKTDVWTATIPDLAVYSSGKPITYTVDESTVPNGYEKSASGTTVTNTLITTTVSGSKTWDDNNNQDNLRPDSITIRLNADIDGFEEQVKVVSADAQGDWKWQFTGLPKFAESGDEITYTITEDSVPGYTAQVNGYNVTNTHTPDTLSIEVNKAWDDDDNRDGKRPTSVTVWLVKNGTKTNQSVTLSQDNHWSDSFDDLPVNENGKPITYTVVEDPILENGEALYSTQYGYETNEKLVTATVTNSYPAKTVEFEVEKVWEDNDNQYNNRPDEIQVQVLADGNPVQIDGKDYLTLTSQKDWEKVRVTDLPMNDAGNQIVYTIKEISVPGYTSQITGNAGQGFTITNTATTFDLPVKEVWADQGNKDGARPSSASFTLVGTTADGKVSRKTYTIQAPAEDGDEWTYTVPNLPTHQNGKEITYSIENADVPLYTTTISPNSLTGDTVSTGFTITNSHTPEMVTVSGQKTWDDKNDQDGRRPDSIIIRLHADVADMAEQAKEVTPDADGNWKWEFANLPKYANGVEIHYSITEDKVDGYQSEVKGYDVTNSYTPGQINVSVTKKWSDANDKDGLRPDSVTIKLFADGNDTGKELVLTEATGWAGSFDNLDEYANGKLIDYTIEEVKVDGYTAEISGSMETGYVVTNSHTPASVDPGTPDDPEQPDNPQDPNTPDNPGKPQDPGTSESPNTPQTGDDSPIGLCVALMVFSGACLTATIACREKSRRRHKARRYR